MKSIGRYGIDLMPTFVFLRKPKWSEGIRKSAFLAFLFRSRQSTFGPNLVMSK